MMRLILFAAAIVSAAPLQAADATGEFAIKGAGLQTCASLARAWDGKTEDLRLYLGWIDGYLTGINQHLASTFDAAPWQTPTTLLGLTRELCRGAGDEVRVVDAFNRLLRDLMPARLREKSGATALRRGDEAIVLYDETIAALERRLAEEGFLPGEPDGIFTEATADAVAAFQTDRGIEVTGLPNQRTLLALFVRIGE